MPVRKNHNLLTCFAMVLVLVFFMIQAAAGQERGPYKPEPKDKCPVCGMFVAKYPHWLAEIVFKDQRVFFFDGAKDLFKYYFNLKKYNPGKKHTDIGAIFVMEYYSASLMNGREAFYVLGSDVYGPMGRELIPFKNQSDAKEFMKDHRGKGIVSFGEVTPELVKSLDQ